MMSRILFADGEPHIRQLFQEELQDEGYEVAVTCCGGKWCARWTPSSPTWFILEVLLPDMSGLETAGWSKAPAGIPGSSSFLPAPPQDLASGAQTLLCSIS